ncbi:emerin-like [Sardina pilchardus]|uniref:emerin-like n=1 Tax=Sardina pilchardus TaxID=27697 RepID=UPI002E13A6F4
MPVILSNKSDDEIRILLDDYGIKHGPVVDSTRHLYEKKLRDAMENERKARLRPRPPSDRSHYREEEEEITYERRRPQMSYLRDEDLRERQWRYREMDDVDNYRMQATYRNMSQSVPAASRLGTAPLATEEKSPSSSGIPLWVKFLVFLLVAAVLFFVFINMEPAEQEPFKRLG